MALKSKLNPFTGVLQKILDESSIDQLTFKAGVSTSASLPPSGNDTNDVRFTNDDGHLHVWNGSSWIDQGDVLNYDWADLANKPSSSVANIDNAVTQTHTHSNKTELDLITDGDHDVRTDNPHTVTKDQVGLANVPNLDTTNAINKSHDQNTDTSLDEGGANEVSAVQAKTAYTHSQTTSGNPHSVSASDVNLGNVQNIPIVSVASFNNLVITRPTVATVTVTTDRAILLDSSDNPKLFSSITETANITASGSNGLDTGSESSSTWYSIWLIAKSDGTIDSLLSISSTSPTMPSGYTYKLRVGWVRNNSSSDFVGFFQYNNEAWLYPAVEVVSAGNATSPTDVDLSSVIPPTARVFIGEFTILSATSSTRRLEVRPNGFTEAWTYVFKRNDGTGAVLSVITDSSRLIEYNVSDSGDAAYIMSRGYRDNF